MKLKLDENLPESLLGELAALGQDVDNVRLEGLAGESDPNVWQAAQNGGRFLITQDLDFSDIRRFAPGTHHGLDARPTARSRTSGACRPHRGRVPPGRLGIVVTLFCVVDGP